MTALLPDIRVGEPVCHEALAVFPLFTHQGSLVDYRLSDAALADSTLLVRELNDGGSVPELLVENRGHRRVLFLEGEELIGAKQNRVLNTSVLVGAGATIKIPVSCVEQGRWRATSRLFAASGAHSPSKVRRTLKQSVRRSLRRRQGHRSDQGEVWRQVSELNTAHNVESETGAMAASFASRQDRIDEFRRQIPYVSGACGMAVAIGPHLVAVDLFDQPATCQAVWNRLLSGVVLDALEAGSQPPQATVADVEQLLATAGSLPWQPSPAAGEGEEYRAESSGGDQASVLAWNNTLIHGSIVAAV